MAVSPAGLDALSRPSPVSSRSSRPSRSPRRRVSTTPRPRLPLSRGGAPPPAGPFPVPPGSPGHPRPRSVFGPPRHPTSPPHLITRIPSRARASLQFGRTRSGAARVTSLSTSPPSGIGHRSRLGPAVHAAPGTSFLRARVAYRPYAGVSRKNRRFVHRMFMIARPGVGCGQQPVRTVFSRPGRPGRRSCRHTSTEVEHV